MGSLPQIRVLRLEALLQLFDFRKRRRELRIPAAACNGLGKHVAHDRETRDQVLRQGSRAAERSQRDGADDPAADAERDGEIGAQTRAPAELRFRHGFCREVGGTRKSDAPAGPKLAEIPGQWRSRAPRDGLEAISGRRAQNFELRALGRKLAQAAAIEVEELDQASEGVLDLFDHAIGREIGEHHGQVGEQALEGQAFGERNFRGVGRVRAL